jgi:outer membrane receptor protein involved in Fe transport
MTKTKTDRVSLTVAVRTVLRRHRQAVPLASAAAIFLGSSHVGAQQASGNPAESTGLQEVLVTAQRRSQNVQDIPYNISVVTPEAIAASGATTLDDLTRVVTGLTTVDQGPAARTQTNNLVLRGLRTESPGGGSNEPLIPGLTADTVSTYFGETPVFFPMVLQDIQRVEVLRGPQGTLYGSGAEGGTIRFIPRRPDFSGFDADVSVTGSYTQNAPQLNGDVHGMLNFPVADNFAIRVVGGYQHLAGFIDAVNLWELGPNGVPVPSIPGNLASGPVIGPEERGVNSSNQGYARVALRWKPSAIMDFQIDYLHQKTTMANSQLVNPLWPGGCRDMTAPDQGAPVSCQGAPISTFHTNAGGPDTNTSYIKTPFDDTIDLGSLVATFDFGLATLTSATSYYDDRTVTTGDEIGPLQDIGGPNYVNFPPYNNYPRWSVSSPTPASTQSFIQELRLASAGQHTFDYVVGAFYQYEKGDASYAQTVPGLQDYLAFIGQPLVSKYPEDVVDIFQRNTTFDDAALFGELTYHATARWQITVGGRVTHQSFTDTFSGVFPLVDAAGVLPPPQTTAYGGKIDRSFDKNLKKLNTSFELTPNTMVYVTYSEGFRHGGTNPLPTAGTLASLPENLVFEPDFARNYEAGLKGTLLERRLRYALAIYRIDLDNFQFNGRSGSGNPATFNGSTARSRGVEFELQAAPTTNLTVWLGYTYTDAKTTAGFVIHDYLPYALIPSLGGTGQPVVLYNIPSGVQMPGVPYNTANIGIDYVIPHLFAGGKGSKLTLHVDSVYRDSSAGDIDPSSLYYWRIPPSIMTNAGARLDVNERMSWDLLITNLTNTVQYTGAENPQTVVTPYSLRIVSRPRTVGLTLNYKF